MPQKRDDLSDLIRRSGLTRAEVADQIGIPYGRLNSYLGGFTPIPWEIEDELKDHCNKAIVEWNAIRAGK